MPAGVPQFESFNCSAVRAVHAFSTTAKVPVVHVMAQPETAPKPLTVLAPGVSTSVQPSVFHAARLVFGVQMASTTKAPLLSGHVTTQPVTAPKPFTVVPVGVSTSIQPAAVHSLTA